MGEINKIYEALLNRQEKVAHKKNIVGLIKEFNKKFKKSLAIEDTLKYMARHNYIKRIFLSYYYINSVEERKRKFCNYQDKELLFMVLNKIDLKWYLGLSSALYYAGEVWQTPTTITIINNTLSGKRKILGVNVRFYKIKDNLIFGIKKEKTEKGIDYYYSIPAKTYLDMIYFRRINKLTETKNTEKYIKKFPKWVAEKK